MCVLDQVHQDNKSTKVNKVFSDFPDGPQVLTFRPETLIQKRRFPKEEPLASGVITADRGGYNMYTYVLAIL